MGTRLQKMLWLAAGYCCLLLAIIGALLPVMPSTVFILLAATCFSRSSPALSHWLYQHPRFGPPLILWQTYKGMTVKTKTIALSMLLLSFGSSIYALRHQPWLAFILLTLWLTLSIWMWRRPTISPSVAACTTLRAAAPSPVMMENPDGRH